MRLMASSKSDSRRLTSSSPRSFIRRISSGLWPITALRIGAIAASRQICLMSAPEYPSTIAPSTGPSEPTPNPAQHGGAMRGGLFQ
jgi:hypothetical protein